jgi:predicted RNase H-like HicB family nuclease
MWETFSSNLKDTANRNVNMRFSVVVEKDSDGYYVASVPELPGCHTQAKTLDAVMERIKEAIQVYLEAETENLKASRRNELVGVQFVEVHA